ncbi:P1 family peptidase [Rhodococcus aerolatus]
MSPAGRHDALTDVPGLAVGHHQRLEPGWATGTTVVLCPGGATAGVDVRGGGPGTRETDLLDPSHLVTQVHAVVLTGGSAFGLAAADGVVGWLDERGHGLQVGLQPGQVVPIVPGAVVFDVGVGDWAHRPDASFGRAACDAAGTGPVAQGCVGAGTGARAGVLKGGVGTASTVLDDGPAAGRTVAALVVANPTGAVVDPRTGLPWEHEDRDARATDAELAALAALAHPSVALNTTIGVVATDAALSKPQCRRLAVTGHDGLARAVRPAHSMLDGDTLFALATGDGAGVPVAVLDAVAEAGAACVARAIGAAVLAATTTAGVPAWRDMVPSLAAARG